MTDIPLCNDCDQRLAAASNAIRLHSTVMRAALEAAKVGLDKEHRKYFRNDLVHSFRAAQSVWDGYREHLKEHGLLVQIDPMDFYDNIKAS
jgi:hypothetical protein